MKRLPLFLLLFSVLLTKSFLGMEDSKIVDPDEISIAGLKREHVILALWNNATGKREHKDNIQFLLTTSLRLPTIEDARAYGEHCGGYFFGRKIVPDFKGENYCGYVYNRDHGPNKAHQVIDALRKCSLEGPLTEKRIFAVVIPENPAVDEAEKERMNTLLNSGKQEEFLAMYQTRRIRQDAEVISLLKSMVVSDPDNEEIDQICNGAVLNSLRRHAVSASSTNTEDNDPAPKATTSASPASNNLPSQTKPTKPSKSSSSTQREPENAPVFSAETEKSMKAGLQRMFDGSNSRPR